MFIVVPLIRSTGLAIVAEANLRCGVFCPKSFRHNDGSFSSFLVLTTRHSLSFHKFERQGGFFGLIMHFSPVDVTWECLIKDFSFFLWNHVFLSVYQWCGFSRYKLFQFWSVSGWYYHFDVLIFIHLFSSTGIVVIEQVSLRWSVFVSIKLSQIGSFHELLVLATECFFSFGIIEIQSDVFFWVVTAFWFCWRFMGVLSFWFWNFCFWNMSFFCSSLMRFFVVQFFSFFRKLCG